ncbi:fimbrillin family protein [Phocaeicola sp.]
MKSVHYIYSILFLFLLSACSEEESTPMMQQAGTFSIEVSDGGFLSVEPGTMTRAAENGYQTVFTNGDRLGLIVTNSSNELVIDNRPFTFDGSKWMDAGGSSNIAYDASYNYLVYYPYSETMNGKKTADGIKTAFVPKTDQRNYADYTASDLMIGSGAFNQAHNVLKVTLQHVMTLLVLLAPQNTAVVNGQTYSWVSEYASNGSFTIDDKVYVSWQSDTKEMRLLLPESALSASESIRYYYLSNDDKKAGSANVNTGQGGKYQQIVPPSVEYTLAPGATYYADGTTLPYAAGYAESSPVGIVCWVGSEAYNDDPLLKEKHSGCNHGLAIALHDAGNGMHWSNSYEMITTEWVNKDGNPYKDKVNLQTSDKWCGYSNTLALSDYNAGMYDSKVSTNNNYRVLPIDALQEYAAAHPAPANSSGWYFPSVTELKNVCWGQYYESKESIDGREMLNAQLAKVGGTIFGNDSYWSSTERSYDSRNAWYVYFDDGNVNYYGRKGSDALRVRLLFAF